MAEITLVAEPGRTTGSSESRRLRAAGRVPAVVYGHGIEGISISVDGRELRHALSGDAGTNQLLELKIGSDSHLAMARVLQRHPVRHTVLHVDFQIVRRDEVISAEVPIVLTGEAKSVAQEGGLVEQQLTALTVRATPARIPNSIEVDITDLNVGEGIRVGDLPLPSGVATEVPEDEIVVIASISTVAAEAAELAEAEAAAAAEAAEGEGAEGEGAEGEGATAEAGEAGAGAGSDGGTEGSSEGDGGEA
ncbi:MAG TPA: 50S ribosomal protein L25 [Acidimicrobiales bacterium]|nr:50S ribosomal protein L25 [Acidimicrobiales bacterium]